MRVSLLDDGMDGASPAGAERRRFPRYDVKRATTLYYEPGNHAARCTIKNVSQTGARILVQEAVDLPDQVALVTPSNRARLALVRWRIGDEFGLEFID
jgi:hypothetical protein